MKGFQIIFLSCLFCINVGAQNMPSTLIELAKTTFEVVKLNPTDPSPSSDWLGGNALNLSAKSIKCSLWGPPDIITFSLSKNDVWDRRYFDKPVLKLQQMIDSIQDGSWKQHYYNSYNAYDFPCPKPVGQIQIRCPELKNAPSPEANLAMSDGVVTINAVDSNASLTVKFANMMTKDVMVLGGETKGITGLTIRLFRHFDTTKRGGRRWSGGGLGQPLQGFDYSLHKDEDGPLDPPTSGVYGNIVWIRQDMPAEKTFPNGFSYLFAAILKKGKANFEVKEGHGLATRMELSDEHKEKSEKMSGYMPKYELINKALGIAADMNIKSSSFCVVFTVVTTLDLQKGQSLLEVAQRRLTQEKGDMALFAENKQFFDDLFQLREKGRIIYDGDSHNNQDIVKKAFRSWTQEHSGSTASDPERFQCDQTYALMESDYSPWHGDIHFNEVEPTSYCVTNQLDRLVIWEKMLKQGLPLAKKNAKDVYGLPGAFYGLAYVPISSDDIYHQHEVWEQSMEITAQSLRVPWLCYEYSGDMEYLKRIWEVLEESCRFYKAYLTKMDDDKWHVYPTVTAERRGFTQKLRENMDSMSALSLISWCLRSGTECARLLGKETDETKSWAMVAQNMAAYPEWNVNGKKVFTDVRNCPLLKEYWPCPQTYPVLLSDDINLDSPQEIKDKMKNTLDVIPKSGLFSFEDKAKYLLAYTQGTTAEHLLNSRSGDAHLFPAVTENSRIVFKDFLAKGGFEISAHYQNKRAENISVTSLAGNRCCLVLPQKLNKVGVYDKTDRKEVPFTIIPAQNNKRERITWMTQKGHKYMVTAS